MVAAEIEKPAARRRPIRPTSPNADVVRKMVADIKSDFGGLDILVNNAGLVFCATASARARPQDWKKQIDTCLYGALNCSHSAGPLLEALGARAHHLDHGRLLPGRRDPALRSAAAARAGTIALMQVAGARVGPLGRNRQLDLARPDRDARTTRPGSTRTARSWSRPTPSGGSGCRPTLRPWLPARIRRRRLDHGPGDQCQRRILRWSDGRRSCCTSI